MREDKDIREDSITLRWFGKKDDVSQVKRYTVKL